MAAYLQGDKLTGGIFFGASVALSADGTTALVGAPSDDSFVGAAYIFVLDAGVWTLEQRIVPATPLYFPSFGARHGAALSADGNTALIGGYQDNAHGTSNVRGAAWVYTRTAGVWTEQQKLTPNDGLPLTDFGHAVALSADGDTALVGGNADDSQAAAAYAGAAWVFVRSAGSWSQQGNKLLPGGAFGETSFGSAVALSADGDLAVITGHTDRTTGPTDPIVGAFWTFTRSGTSWSQLGSKVSGTTGNPFSSDIALDADGLTVAIGGYYTIGGGTSTPLIFTRSGSTWSEQDALTAADIPTGSESVVALSPDGTVAFVGAAGDLSGQGSALQFEVSAGVWTQVGDNFTPDNASGNANFGKAITARTGIALIGGVRDNTNGAAWIYEPAAVGVLTVNFDGATFPMNV